MQPLPGEKILVCHDFADPNSIAEYTVKQAHRDTITCVGEGNTFYNAQCWPARVRPELTKICAIRQAFKKELDDSMKLVYELKNAITRGEK